MGRRQPVVSLAEVEVARTHADDGQESRDALSRFSRIVRAGEPALVVLALIAVWETVARLELIPREDFPLASTIGAAFIGDLQSSALWQGVAASMQAWGLGMLIVVAVGVPTGMLLGASTISYRLSYLTLEFIRTLPGIAALPLLLFVFGIGLELTVALVVLAALWPVLIQSMYGMRDIDPISVAATQVFGVGRFRRFFLVDVPSCTPHIATGLRISGTFALIFAIATSLVVGGEGLGAAMAEAASIGDRPLVYARVLAAGLLGLLITGALTAIERKTMSWHPSKRGVGQ